MQGRPQPQDTRRDSDHRRERPPERRPPAGGALLTPPRRTTTRSSAPPTGSPATRPTPRTWCSASSCASPARRRAARRRRRGLPLPLGRERRARPAALAPARGLGAARGARRRAPTRRPAGPEFEPSTSAAEQLRKTLRSALSRLSPRAAEVFTLRYFEGLGNQEIAGLLGSSPGRRRRPPPSHPLPSAQRDHQPYGRSVMKSEELFEQAVAAVRDENIDPRTVEAGGRARRARLAHEVQAAGPAAPAAGEPERTASTAAKASAS